MWKHFNVENESVGLNYGGSQLFYMLLSASPLAQLWTQQLFLIILSWGIDNDPLVSTRLKKTLIAVEHLEDHTPQVPFPALDRGLSTHQPHPWSCTLCLLSCTYPPPPNFPLQDSGCPSCRWRSRLLRCDPATSLAAGTQNKCLLSSSPNPWASELLASFAMTLSEFIQQHCWQTQPRAMLLLSPAPSGFWGQGGAVGHDMCRGILLHFLS